MDDSIYDDQACFFGINPYYVKQNQKDQPLFKSIGAIICLDKGVPITGTAFVINSSMILTAAHNVHTQPRGEKGLRDNIMFYPRAFGELGKGINIKYVQVCEEYVKGSPQVAYDYAFCLLEEEVNKDWCIDIGYNFEYGPMHESKASKIHIYGYPGENWKKLSPDISKYDYKVSLRGLHVAAENFFNRIKIVDLNKGCMRHLISTLKGQSGSPIIAEINGEFIAIGLVKGAKHKIKNENRQPEYNRGVLFNKIFIENLKKFLLKHKVNTVRIRNLDLLNLSSVFWDLNTMEKVSSFEIKDGLVTRTKFWDKQKLGIRSMNLKKLLFYSITPKLRLINFHDEILDSRIQVGVIMRNKEKKDDVVSYITYSRGQGRIQKGGKVMFKEFEDDLFISENQILELTVDMAKGEVSFEKGGKKYPIALEKSYSEEVEVFFYTKMMFEGSRFEVVPQVMEEL